LSLGDIESLVETLGIDNFRGVFMRQLLPTKCTSTECGIINLGDVESNGTHWTCYVKDGERRKLYFDSFGNVKPPKELVQYLGGDGLVYNTFRVQTFNDPPICGHLCLEVLRRHTNGEDWADIERILRNNKYVWRSWFSH